MTVETQKDFAARLGKDAAYVTRLKKRGALVGAHGRVLGEKERALIDVERSLARMQYLGVGLLRPDVAERHAAGRGEQPARPSAEIRANTPDDETGEDDAVAEDDDGGLAGDESSLTRNKRLAMHFQNGLLKIGMALKMGSRFYLKDVHDEGREVGNAMRATLDRMIDQLAPILAVTRDAAARRALIDQHLARERRQVNRAFPSALRRLRRSAKGE